VSKYEQKVGEGLVFAKRSAAQRISSDDNKISRASYLAMCAKFNLKPGEYEKNAQEVEVFLKCGWIQRKKMSKKEVLQLPLVTLLLGYDCVAGPGCLPAHLLVYLPTY